MVDAINGSLYSIVSRIEVLLDSLQSPCSVHVSGKAAPPSMLPLPQKWPHQTVRGVTENPHFIKTPQTRTTA